ncbi:uncharacterized protein LOC121988434 isoform X1 [Zingiber officinale]|uniref:RING-type domain-containing protein n=1 Tax=Zingiber officinale TaxID=94328 RepID=A0A8J5M602_ZINOF|nr:uncharacterized protein LOC121988434 isoform X1 [Zingiber officinale]KAG6534611.1 hypothetical protein ZIOFF_008514 [Zingiber officinale]
MGYDAMANVSSLPLMVSGRKKRSNRSAKLKQCKLDARREQWLSHGKDKDGDFNLTTALHLQVPPLSSKGTVREELRDGITSMHECRDMDSPLHKPTVGNHHRRNISSGVSRSSRSSSMDFTSSSTSDGEEEEYIENREEENGVLDDWEAVADALTKDVGSVNHTHRSAREITPFEAAATLGIPVEAHLGGSTTKPEPIHNTKRAWRPDDTSRPPSLPTISKQWIFPANAGWNHRISQQKGILPLPIPCPICCEDLDLTDSNFLPCSCGFRLCLFCHKRILEADGRCPGCRQQYNSIPGGTVEVNMGGARAPILQMQLSHICNLRP